MSRHRHSLTYELYLASPLWRYRRRLWILQAGGRCERCGNRHELAIHHRNYKRLVRERRSDIQVLCRPCHQQVQHGTAPPARPLSRLKIAAVLLFFVVLAFTLGKPSDLYKNQGPGKPTISRQRHHLPNLREPARVSLRPNFAPPPAPSLQGRRLPSPHPTGSVPLGRTAARTGLVQTTRTPTKEER
jgi:hypothetical protein